MKGAKMNLKNYYSALVKLEQAYNALKKAELFECAQEIGEMYDLINNEYCEEIEQANEIKREMDKGGKK